MKGLLARLKQGGEDGQAVANSPEHRTSESPFPPKKFLLGNFLDSGLGKASPDGVFQNGFGNDLQDSPPNSARSEDMFAIKMVRNCNTDSSPQDGRTSRTSKLGKELSFSINTLDNDREEPELIGLDDEDDGYVSPSAPMPSTQAWAMFEESIKHIDDSVEMFTKKPKPTSISSENFKSVMIDMYGDSEYGSKRRHTKLFDKFGGISKKTGLASRAIFNAKHKTPEEEEEKVEENKADDAVDSGMNGDEEDSEDNETGRSLFTRRGWKVLKRQVNETSMETNTAAPKLQWTALKQTLKGLSNTERTRRDLYERYGIIPIVRPDGTTVQENTMLSERAKAELAKKSNLSSYLSRRPASYHHPVSYSRAISHTSRGSETGSETVPPKSSKKKSKVKQRPQTSKR